MNNKFDEMAKGLAQSVTRWQALKRFGVGLAGIALALGLSLSASADNPTPGPLIELSRPNAVGTCDDGFRLPGTMTVNDAAEPTLAVNPANPNNIVAAWIQGPLQNNVAAVSLDGGVTWKQVPLPYSVCSGGTFQGAGDPWVSFAPNGDLYCLGITGPSPANTYAAVMKSTDGGLHWSAPIILDSPPLSPDKTTLTADTFDARFVYAAWIRLPVKNKSALTFSRTTDGGASWEPSRVIYETVPGQQAFNTQILVLPDGTLVDIFYHQFQKNNGAASQLDIQLMRSSDKGQTWSAPIPAVAMQTILRSDNTGYTLTVDPDNGQLVRDTTNPSFAVDSRSGNLYAVWEDGRFSNFQYNDIAFSMSSDGGFTWSAPIRINQTPFNSAPLNRQAFYPVIAVGLDGTIGVTYYDFRFNTAAPGVPTDYWLVKCHPSDAAPATNPANWGNEVRLTTTSFNLEALPFVIDGFWFGDYLGLAPAGEGFISAFGAVDQDGITSIFARRIAP
jgi:hypothetical protein